MTELISQFETRITGIIDQAKDIETSNINLRADIEDMQLDFERDRQYSISRNFLIADIPVQQGENLKKEILRLMGTSDITLKGVSSSTVDYRAGRTHLF